MGDRNNLTVAGGGVLGGQIAWHSAYSGKNVDVADASFSTRSTRSCAPPASTRISIPSTGPFYYARVREIPTPTWQAYDSKVYSVDMLDTIQMKGQDRAYTSPICYTP
jgi:hypothetical protein